MISQLIDSEHVKITYSIALVLFSIVVVTTLNMEGNTQVAQDILPSVSLLVLWLSIISLSFLEGGQLSILKLKSIQPERFHESYPITSSIYSVGCQGDNLERYLLGRQFLVIILIFTISLCATPLADATVLDLPSWIQTVFIQSGIAVTSLVVIIGQLPAQEIARQYMLDYTNNSVMTITLYVALIIEASGLLHVVYLIQYFLCWLSGKPLETNEAQRSCLQALFFWGRCILSLAILAFSMAVTFDAMLQGQTTTWDSLSSAVAVILFLGLLLVGGILEGIHLASIAVSQLPKSDQEIPPMARKTCDLMLLHGDQDGLPGFVVGRQWLVTLCFVVMAHITKVNVDSGVEEENILGVSDGMQTFLNLGYLGAIVTTIMGSLLWQKVASIYPLEFLAHPVCYMLVYLCVWLEASAICSAYRLVGTIYRKVAGLERDEVYIGDVDDLATVDDVELASEADHSTAEPQ
jgi:hypothetical protein